MSNRSPVSGARPPRDSSVSSWPRPDAASPTAAAAASPRRSPRKPARPVRLPPFVVETDPAVLARREKQIEYGKNTLSYQQYTAAVPRTQRLGYHPRTPVKRRLQSRRRWDNAVKCWRVHLHYWNDPVKLAALRAGESGSDSSSVLSDPADGAAAAAAPPEREHEQEEVLNWADDVEGLALELEG